jgi:hypothetical protein
MRRIALVGVNALLEPVKLSNKVVSFVDSTHYITIEKSSPGVIKLMTLKGTYFLKRHTQLNIYQGECAGRKVNVSLKKIVGEVRF